MVAVVFSMQGLGQPVAAVLALVVSAPFKGTLQGASSLGQCNSSCQNDVDIMW